MRIRILTFGPLRSQGEDIVLTLPENATLADVREGLIGRDVDARLLARSRFATETALVEESERLVPDSTLALITPVSGG